MPNAQPTQSPPLPTIDLAERQRRAEIKAEQDRSFDKYWNEIVRWSKAQHGGVLALERRCNKANCANLVAHFFIDIFL